MPDDITVEWHTGRYGRAEAWRHFLPADSEAIHTFQEPATLIIRGPIHEGPPPGDPDHPMRIFTGTPVRWQDVRPLIARFARLWPEILRSVSGTMPDSVGLVYFASGANVDELYSLLPCMPLEFTDPTRFFIREVCRDAPDTSVPWGRICVEYTYEGFKRLVGPEGFSYFYGSCILGLWVAEARVPQYLRANAFEKGTLENLLGNECVRCWWLCDTDFEGLTLWHRDHSGGDLVRRLLEAVAGCE